MALIPNKFNGYSRDNRREYHILQAGGGSSSTTVNLTDEQKDLLKYQTQQLKDVFMPAYTSTVGGAKDVYGTLSPYMNQAALNAYNTYGNVSGAAINKASEAYGQGMGTLSQLFDPNYERNQVQAALQAGREATREQLGQQNAMYGAAGGLGSARQALADKNLATLAEQRQATAAAGAQAQVQQNRMAAANSILGAGQSLANIGLASTGQQLTAAQTPMDLYSKYASVVFGTPQASTVPNFAGTQGSSSRGFGFNFGTQGGGSSLFG